MLLCQWPLVFHQQAAGKSGARPEEIVSHTSLEAACPELRRATVTIRTSARRHISRARGSRSAYRPSTQGSPKAGASLV